MRNINLATLFDKNYLIRALTMRESLISFCPDIRFWFLCLDDESEDILKRLDLKNVEVVNIKNLNNQDLLKVRDSRSQGEFAFTAKSSWLYFIANNPKISENDLLVWADADIVFYSSPLKIFEDCEKYSITLTSHKFSKKELVSEKKYGKYNAGTIIFKINQTSKECLKEWSGQCIDWCYLKYEDGRLGDQMYLNSWPEKYKDVYELPNKGFNLGSWNIRKYKIRLDKEKNILIDGEPLVCYHFHGVKMYIANKVHPIPLSVLNVHIFDKYSRCMDEALEMVSKFDASWRYGFVQKPSILRIAKQLVHRFLREQKRRLKALWIKTKGL